MCIRDSCIIAVDCIQDHICAIYGFPQDLCRKDTGNVQVSCYFSSKGVFAVLHILSLIHISFGTNDLTQMTFGFSRDDAGKFLGAYYDKKIYESDPFAKLDQTGVGKLVKMAAQLGRETRADLHLGICGEHGGDPSSVEFCHNVGLDLSVSYTHLILWTGIRWMRRHRTAWRM